MSRSVKSKIKLEIYRLQRLQVKSLKRSIRLYQNAMNIGKYVEALKLKLSPEERKEFEATPVQNPNEPKKEADNAMPILPQEESKPS